LGAHRAAARACAIVCGGAADRRAGLIDFQRGQISILDREGLERAACEHYRLNKDAYDRIYGSV
jgi:hypothetical protein